MPHISVIIPVYNAGNYIVDTLNSVLQQTLKDIEVMTDLMINLLLNAIDYKRLISALS